MSDIDSPFLRLLRNRIDIRKAPFSGRGSRLLVFRDNDHFSIRLAERWLKREHELAAYRRRPPLLDNLVLLDSNGNILPVEITTYPHCVECSTDIGMFRLTFADPETICILLPETKCGIRFEARVDQALPDRRGGILRLVGEIRRNIAVTTNATVLENSVTCPDDYGKIVCYKVDASAGRCAMLINITPRLGFNRYIPEPLGILRAAAERWHDWFARAPEVDPQYQSQYYYAWWIMRAGLISPRYFTTREVMTPSKIHYVGAWAWDSYFHALAYRHVDAHLAQDQLRILLDHQKENGMIPDAVHDEGVVTHLAFPVDADVTKPPLIAWAVLKLHETNPDVEFLNEVYESLVPWNNWWFAENDPEGNGLCNYMHPFSSGLDDSPLWDDGMPVEAPDLNSYLCLQQEALGKIAAAIGEPADAKLWAERADAMAERILRLMWDPEAGLFWASRKGKRIEVRTPFNLFPLITGRLPGEVVDRLVAHLTDEREFWSRYPVPTVAMDDPKYNPERMWRGPTWANVNYLLAEGLSRCGRKKVALELRRRTLDLIGDLSDIYEYYHPETGVNPPSAAPVFGWSAAIYIDFAIQASREIQTGR